MAVKHIVNILGVMVLEVYLESQEGRSATVAVLGRGMNDTVPLYRGNTSTTRMAVGFITMTLGGGVSIHTGIGT